MTPIDVNDEIPLMTVHTGTRTISYKKSTGDADAAFDIYQVRVRQECAFLLFMRLCSLIHVSYTHRLRWFAARKHHSAEYMSNASHRRCA